MKAVFSKVLMITSSHLIRSENSAGFLLMISVRTVDMEVLLLHLKAAILFARISSSVSVKKEAGISSQTVRRLTFEYQVLNTVWIEHAARTIQTSMMKIIDAALSYGSSCRFDSPFLSINKNLIR